MGETRSEPSRPEAQAGGAAPRDFDHAIKDGDVAAAQLLVGRDAAGGYPRVLQ